MTGDEWYAALCRACGWPATAWTIAGLREWARMESPREENGETVLFNHCYNPLATTMPASDVPRSPQDIGFGPGKWNDANPPHGVAIYDKPENGVRATAATIVIPWAYARIRDTFKNQRVTDRAGLIEDFTTWIGNPGYATALTDYLLSHPASTASAPAPVNDDAELAALRADVGLLVAVVAGNGARAKDGTVLTGRAALADQAQRGNSLALGLTLTQENLQALAGQVIALARNPSVNGVSRAETVAGLEAVAAGIQTLIDSFSEAKG